MKSLHKHRLSTPFKIVLSFLFIILVGSLILNLPISQTDQSQANYFDPVSYTHLTLPTIYSV